MILVLPVVLWILIFNYIPMLGLTISFQGYNRLISSLEEKVKYTNAFTYFSLRVS